MRKIETSETRVLLCRTTDAEAAAVFEECRTQMMMAWLLSFKFCTSAVLCDVPCLHCMSTPETVKRVITCDGGDLSG